MPRAALSKVSLKQLLAELDRRKGRLADLLAQREAVTREIAELESLGFSADVEQAPMVMARRGRPPGKRGPQPASVRAAAKTLADYVKETVATAAKGLSVTEIERRVLASEYPTKAKRLYKQIMVVLGKGGFNKVSRGVYKVAGAARQAGQAAVAAAAKAMAETPGKAKTGRKRKQFAQTAEQFIFQLVKGKGAATPAINQAWRAAGRGGKADQTLSQMTKAGKLNREKLGGKKGSIYTAA